MKKIVWVMLIIIFVTFFIFWLQRQKDGDVCVQCSSMLFPEESQDVEASLVDQANQDACLLQK